jgi:site-specific recombinase XerD
VLPGARNFFKYLRQARVINTPETGSAQDPVLLTAFGQWMRQQRGTSEVTLAKYRPDIGKLLLRAHEDPKQIDAGLLRELVFEKHRTAGPSMVGICTHALRMFIRFLIATGRCPSGLDAAIPTIAHWDLAPLPRYLPPDEVGRLLASSNRPSRVGRRNHAILLLLARLGLRAGEIVHLRLGDIDWADASIRVCGKGHRPMRLPLTQELGQALVAYVQKGRPRTSTDALFVTSRAPFRALGGASTVSVLVADEMRRAGVVRPSRGAAHLLRHSVATNLLRQGASLQDIQALLRHQSVKTTQIYTKVDVAALREIAQPWPEVSPCESTPWTAISQSAGLPDSRWLATAGG